MTDEIAEVMKVFYDREVRKGSFLTRALASLYYQLKILASYKMHIALEFLDITLSVLIYYFVGFLVSPQALSSLGYSPDYLAFAVLGISMSRYLWTSISRLARKLHHEISEGTFESLVAIDTDNFKSWLTGQVIYGFTWSSMWFVGTLAVGLFLGAKVVCDFLLWVQAIFILILTIVVHVGIGIVAAGMYIKHKQLETMLFFLSLVMEFFGGVLYPLSLLYNYRILYYISILLPFTHGLEMFRRTLMDGWSLLHPRMIFHMAFLLLFLPLIYIGFKVFERYLNMARKEGILGAY